MTIVMCVGRRYIQAPLMIPLIFITSSFKTYVGPFNRVSSRLFSFTVECYVRSLQEKYASLMESPNLVLTAARKSDGSTPLSAEAQSLLKDAFVAPCMCYVDRCACLY